MYIYICIHTHTQKQNLKGKVVGKIAGYVHILKSRQALDDVTSRVPGFTAVFAAVAASVFLPLSLPLALFGALAVSISFSLAFPLSVLLPLTVPSFTFLLTLLVSILALPLQILPFLLSLPFFFFQFLWENGAGRF